MRYIILIFAVLTLNIALAQSPNREIKVGDIFPKGDVVNILTKGVPGNLKLDELRDKLVILDFWHTGCGTCIEGLPKMENLNKIIGKSLQILPVTFQKEADIIDFWKNNKYTKSLSIPTVVNDKLLHSYFPNRATPHEVWIFKGKVVAITFAEYVNKENILSILNGNEISWPVKNDYLAFDRNIPLFNPDADQLDTTKAVTYAAACGFLENMFSTTFSDGPSLIRNKAKKTVRLMFPNQSIYNIYSACFSRISSHSDLKDKPGMALRNEIVWEVADRNRYRYEFKEDYMPNGYWAQWQRDNAVCFESQHLDIGQDDKQIYRDAISDLNGILGLNVRWEKRKEKIYILEKIAGFKTSVKNSIKGTSYMLSKVWTELNDHYGNPYVYIDESKTADVKVTLNVKSWTDVGGIKSGLEAQGYTLREEERLVDKYVFSEVNGGLLIDWQMQAAFQKEKDAQKDLKLPTDDENAAFMKKNSTAAGVVVLPSGLQYKMLKKGNGRKPVASDKVSVNYKGMLVNGKIFDSSYERGRPLDMSLKDVIPGWQEGLQLMGEGSKWILYVPAKLAYAEHTGQGKFPPNSNMIFEIELLKVLPGKSAAK